jgi:hypothetical protein
MYPKTEFALMLATTLGLMAVLFLLIRPHLWALQGP